MNKIERASERGRQIVNQLLENALSHKEMACKLGISEEEVINLQSRNKILAIKRISEVYCYPIQQFDNNDKILIGLDKTLEVLTKNEIGKITQLSFLTTGNIRLGGKTPIQSLKEFNIEGVVNAAKCYGNHIAF